MGAPRPPAFQGKLESERLISGLRAYWHGSLEQPWTPMTMLDPLLGSSKQRFPCSLLTWGGSSPHRHQLGGDRRGEPGGPTPLGAFPLNFLPAVPTVSSPSCPL